MVQSWALPSPLPSRLGFFQPGRHTSTVRGRELAGIGTGAVWPDSKAQGGSQRATGGDDHNQEPHKSSISPRGA